jgi:tetratricopeptide (TPR) repeat protein
LKIVYKFKIFFEMSLTVKKNLLLLGVIVVFTQLVGCASHEILQSTPPVIEKSEPTPPAVKQPEKPVEPVGPPQIVPQTKAPIPMASSNATASLVSQARSQYQAKNYQAAIATAERALRIDRRSPEVYLVLAQSYMQLANTQLAMQFVQQGIRYSQAGTELAQALMQVRDSLLK